MKLKKKQKQIGKKQVEIRKKQAKIENLELDSGNNLPNNQNTQNIYLNLFELAEQKRNDEVFWQSDLKLLKGQLKLLEDDRKLLVNDLIRLNDDLKYLHFEETQSRKIYFFFY